MEGTHKITLLVSQYEWIKSGYESPDSVICIRY